MKYLVWLTEALGPANPRTVGALEFFGNAEKIYISSREEKVKSKCFTKGDLTKLQNLSISAAEKILKDCKTAGISLLPITDKRYPQTLKMIDSPPVLLYYKGELPDFNSLPSLSVVGPRKISDFGKKASLSLSFRLARAGFIIVSGGAIGGDYFAHLGALKGQGTTVLVMACGILSDYLPENKPLRDAVEKSGCLLSECSPYTEPNRYSFPVRNRIMSGLTLGTVVIEAGVRSGALITARLANEQGRDVFVIPGLPNAPEYKGSNALLRDGATAVLDLSDIFNEYIARFPDKINIERAYSAELTFKKEAEKQQKIQKEKIVTKKINETLSKEAKIVYNCLDKQKFLPEEIKNTGLTSAELLSALTELEMEFLIRAIPGGMYEICN